MVKHVESADEFDALKKASKPVRPFILFLLSAKRRAMRSIVVVARGEPANSVSLSISFCDFSPTDF